MMAEVISMREALEVTTSWKPESKEMFRMAYSDEYLKTIY
jgi:hypothetical protein